MVPWGGGRNRHSWLWAGLLGGLAGISAGRSCRSRCWSVGSSDPVSAGTPAGTLSRPGCSGSSCCFSVRGRRSWQCRSSDPWRVGTRGSVVPEVQGPGIDGVFPVADFPVARLQLVEPGLSDVAPKLAGACYIISGDLSISWLASVPASLAVDRSSGRADHSGRSRTRRAGSCCHWLGSPVHRSCGSRCKATPTFPWRSCSCSGRPCCGDPSGSAIPRPGGVLLAGAALTKTEGTPLVAIVLLCLLVTRKRSALLAIGPAIVIAAQLPWWLCHRVSMASPIR